VKNQLLAFFGFGLLLATGSAYAQSFQLKANVPFNFVVTARTLLGGEYTIRSEKTEPQHELSINAIGQTSRVFLAVPCLSLKGEKASNQTKLVFDRYGDQYFLAEIWEKGKSVGLRLPKTRREAEMAKSNSLQQTVIVAELR
jgi:hypothetical protein